MSNPINRREFLGAGAASASAMLLAGRLNAQSITAAATANWPPKMPDVKIYKVYLDGVKGWPKPDLDIQAEIARLEKHLAETERRLGDVKFVGGDVVRHAGKDADKLAHKLRDVDGVLAFNLNTIVESQFKPFVAIGKPTALFSQPYSGHDWCKVCKMPKLGKKVVLLATSDYGEITQIAGLMRVVPRLRQTRIIYIGNGPMKAARAAEFKGKLGVEVVSVGHKRLNEVYEAIDSKQAEAEAEQWIRNAQKVVEPSREEIVKSSRLYLAMKKIMTDEHARAITIDCLGLFSRRALPAYPCLGFSKLNDTGLVGACEADMDSTLTMLIFGYAFGIPGFISDPVFDTSTNTLIHAHCVSATKMDGPAGPRCPYIIRNHLEDYKGAALQVIHQKGRPMTCAKLVNLDTILISTGEITGSPDVDRGCRTKIATKVADARSMLDNWGCGITKGGWVQHLHRVVFYGNHLQNIKHLATLTGLKVVEEV